jgi:hypothetical protein
MNLGARLQRRTRMRRVALLRHTDPILRWYLRGMAKGPTLYDQLPKLTRIVNRQSELIGGLLADLIVNGGGPDAPVYDGPSLFGGKDED